MTMFNHATHFLLCYTVVVTVISFLSITTTCFITLYRHKPIQ